MNTKKDIPQKDIPELAKEIVKKRVILALGEHALIIANSDKLREILNPTKANLKITTDDFENVGRE